MAAYAPPAQLVDDAQMSLSDPGQIEGEPRDRRDERSDAIAVGRLGKIFRSTPRWRKLLVAKAREHLWPILGATILSVGGTVAASVVTTGFGLGRETVYRGISATPPRISAQDGKPGIARENFASGITRNIPLEDVAYVGVKAYGYWHLQGPSLDRGHWKAPIIIGNSGTKEVLNKTSFEVAVLIGTPDDFSRARGTFRQKGLSPAPGLIELLPATKVARNR